MAQEMMVAAVSYDPGNDSVSVLMVHPDGSYKMKMFYRARDPDNKCHCAVSGCCFPSGHIGNHRAADGHFIGNDFELGVQTQRIQEVYQESCTELSILQNELATEKQCNELHLKEKSAMQQEIDRLRKVVLDTRDAKNHEIKQLRFELDSLRYPKTPAGAPKPVGDREMRAMVRREVGESAVAQVKGIERPTPMMISCQGDWEP